MEIVNAHFIFVLVLHLVSVNGLVPRRRSALKSACQGNQCWSRRSASRSNQVSASGKQTAVLLWDFHVKRLLCLGSSCHDELGCCFFKTKARDLPRGLAKQKRNCSANFWEEVSLLNTIRISDTVPFHENMAKTEQIDWLSSREPCKASCCTEGNEHHLHGVLNTPVEYIHLHSSIYLQACVVETKFT